MTSTVRGAICDDKWLYSEFMDKVANRGPAVTEVRVKSSAGSAASASCDHIHDWIIGTIPG